MAVLKVPVNCGGITTTTSGAQVPASQLVTITAAEMTDIITNDLNSLGSSPAHPQVVSSNITTGALVVSMAKSITSITMNGNVYAVTNGISASMAAVDGTQLCYEGFTEVTG